MASLQLPGVLFGISVMLVLLATLIAVRMVARSASAPASGDDAWLEPESEEEKAGKYLYRPQQKTAQAEGVERAARASEPRHRARRVDLSDLPEPGDGGAVFMALDPARLSIGLVNATLAWRLRIKNAGTSHLVSLRITSDVTFAHASLAEQDQLRGPDLLSARPQKVHRLDPGTETAIAGEWQIPLEQIRMIEQDNMRLLLLLGRVRIVGAGIAPLRRAFVIGLPADGESERLQPIRVDDGPKVIERLAARLIDTA